MIFIAVKLGVGGKEESDIEESNYGIFKTSKYFLMKRLFLIVHVHVGSI